MLPLLQHWILPSSHLRKAALSLRNHNSAFIENKNSGSKHCLSCLVDQHTKNFTKYFLEFRTNQRKSNILQGSSTWLSIPSHTWAPVAYSEIRLPIFSLSLGSSRTEVTVVTAPPPPPATQTSPGWVACSLPLIIDLSPPHVSPYPWLAVNKPATRRYPPALVKAAPFI